MSFPTREVCTNLIKKMCADPPYSQTGLRQPIVPYVEAYAQRRSTSMVLCLLIKKFRFEVAVRLGIKANICESFSQIRCKDRHYF